MRRFGQYGGSFLSAPGLRAVSVSSARECPTVPDSGRQWQSPGDRALMRRQLSAELADTLTTATKMSREMGMTYGLEKAEAEMTELAI
jgi:hypothetical protein